MARPGRKPHAREIVARVLELLGRGLSQRQTAQQLAISRKSVQDIQHGCHCRKGEPTGKIGPGETQLAEKIECDGCGHSIDVVPCRICIAIAEEASGGAVARRIRNTEDDRVKRARENPKRGAARRPGGKKIAAAKTRPTSPGPARRYYGGAARKRASGPIGRPHELAFELDPDHEARRAKVEELRQSTAESDRPWNLPLTI